MSRPNFEEHVFVPIGPKVDAHGNHPILREIAVPIEFKDRNLLFHGEPEDTCSEGAGTRKNKFAVHGDERASPPAREARELP